MKKHLLLFVFVLVSTALRAQHRDLYSLMFRDKTDCFYEIYNSMQQRDGDHIIDVYLIEDDGSDDGIPYGRVCYKMSSTTQAIADSLFVADTTRNATFLARDPQGDGNIRAAFEYHEDSDSTFARISHFPDDDLHFNPEEDVVVPICEGVAQQGCYRSLIDCRGDLVMTYFKQRNVPYSDQYIARIGLDGTLKQQAMLIENQMPDVKSLRLLKDSPIQYYQWHYLSTLYDKKLPVDVMDSTFNKETVILDRILSSELIASHPIDSTLIVYVYVYEYLTFNYNTEVIPVGGNDVLVAAEYTHDTNFYATTGDFGVAVAKYDINTAQLKGYVVFNDNHGYYSTGSPMGLKMMDDGTVYFLYKEYGFSDESIVVVKMDTNFNVEWRRFCKTWDVNMLPSLESPILFKDGAGEEKGITWCGYAIKDGNYDNLGWVYFMLNHDGTVGVTKGDLEIRPYAYYPNPAQDELHLHYSPDVTPTQIELYDLQGRLVRSQRNGLESLNLQGLAAGTYTMRVTLEGGKVFSDKVVKE